MSGFQVREARWPDVPSRRGRQVQRLGDLFVRQLREVSQHDHLAVLGRECEDGCLYSPAAFAHLEGIGRRADGRETRRDLFEPPAVALGVEALIDQDPVDPAEKPACLVERVELLVRLDEDVLGGITGCCVVPEHAEGNGEEQALVPNDDGLEGVRVTGAAPFDEGEIVGITVDIPAGG